VKQCPHCLKVWQRDVNACRYLISYLLILLGILL
jgi:transposase